jgi:hypothetical protein
VRREGRRLREGREGRGGMGGGGGYLCRGHMRESTGEGKEFRFEVLIEMGGEGGGALRGFGFVGV